VWPDTSREGLAQLFSRTEFLIDQSYLEGLGLMPLEAAFCGCIPVTGGSGGAQYIFKDGENAIVTNGYKHLRETLDRIESFTDTEKDSLRDGAMKLRTELNLELGLQDAVDYFSSGINRSARPFMQ
jgi:glycosyltransferase involved in cell wall biosynthesis